MLGGGGGKLDTKDNHGHLLRFAHLKISLFFRYKHFATLLIEINPQGHVLLQSLKHGGGESFQIGG